MTMVQLICNLSKGKMVLRSEDISSESEYFEDSQWTFMMVRKTLCILMAIFIEAANIVGMKQRRGNRTFLSSQSKWFCPKFDLFVSECPFVHDCSKDCSHQSPATSSLGNGM